MPLQKCSTKYAIQRNAHTINLFIVQVIRMWCWIFSDIREDEFTMRQLVQAKRALDFNSRNLGSASVQLLTQCPRRTEWGYASRVSQDLIFCDICQCTWGFSDRNGSDDCSPMAVDRKKMHQYDFHSSSKRLQLTRSFLGLVFIVPKSLKPF